MQNSIWLSGAQQLSSTRLSGSIDCDVCIVGGGLTGVYTAYLLAKKGVNVALIEANSSVAIATTGHSTGKLTPQHDAVYSQLLKVFSEEEAKLYYRTNVDAIENAILQATVEIYQKADSYIYAKTELGMQTIKDEVNAYKKLGISGIETTDTELPFSVLAALKLENTVQIHPTNFTTHFAKLAVAEGAQFYTNTRITKVEIDQNCVYCENDFKVSYKNLVLATHYPIESVKGLMMAKLSIDRSYLLASKAPELLKGQYISVDTPVRTMRTALIENKPYFIYGGTSHKAGTREDTHSYYETLEKEMVSIFDLPKPEFMWSAQDPDTADSVPYIGRITSSEPNVFIATGYRKWGLSSSLVAGEIISTAITDGRHPATDLFTPSRNQFGRTLLRMLKVIGFVTSSLAGGYLTRLEAPKCTHLGCKTRWNEADETWDCPCHGSRYDKFGNVIEGPAVYPLDLNK